MSELKWWEIERAVWERGPRAKAACQVLAQLAKHSDAEGVTFVGQKTIAARMRQSENTVKRAIAQLEREGWFTVEERAALIQTKNGDLQRRGNRYTLNLVRLGLAIASSGRPLAKGNGNNNGVEGDFPAGSSDEGVIPAAKSRVEGQHPAREGRVGWSREGVEGCARPVQTVSARSHLSGAEVSNESRRGLILGPPLNKKNKQENRTQRQNPSVGSPSQCATVEIEKSLGEAPHAADAPPAHEQRKNLAGYHGGSGRVLAFRREPRQRTELRNAFYASVRSTLDGDEAALWDEVDQVLRFCGVSPETAGRKQRRAVSEALRLCVQEAWAPEITSIAAAGELARKRWKEYVASADLMIRPSGVTHFFGSGEWLNVNLWPFSLAGQERMRRGRL